MVRYVGEVAAIFMGVDHIPRPAVAALWGSATDVRGAGTMAAIFWSVDHNSRPVVADCALRW